MVFDTPQVGRVLESIRPGSLENTMTPANAQLIIGQFKDGSFVSHGCAVRFDNFLVVPDHVLSYPRGPNQTNRIFAMGKTIGPGVDLTDKEPLVIDTDLVYLKLTEKEWSTIGVGKMNIFHDVGQQGAYAQIVGHENRGTTGILSHDPTVFGRIIYDSSTFPGYSGAPYIVCNRIAGIHQCGGERVNGGYSASYIWATINHMENRRPELTPNFLREQYEQGEEIHIDNSYGSPDDIRIRTGGQYHIVARTSMNSSFGTDWIGKKSIRMSKKKRQYADHDSHDYDHSVYENSENQKGPRSGGLLKLEKEPHQEATPVSSIMTLITKLSDEQQREIIRDLSHMRAKKNTPRGLMQQTRENH